MRILVKSAAAATTAFGPYVQPIEGVASDADAIKSAVNGANTVVVPGKLGALLPELQRLADAGQPRHVVLVSSVGAPSAGVLSLFDGDGAVLRDDAREADVLAVVGGDRCTVVRAARIRDSPGGAAAIEIGGDGSPAGEVCREDLARVVAAAALQQGGGRVVRVANAPGEPPADVAALFASAV